MNAIVMIAIVKKDVDVVADKKQTAATENWWRLKKFFAIHSATGLYCPFGVIEDDEKKEGAVRL